MFCSELWLTPLLVDFDLFMLFPLSKPLVGFDCFLLFSLSKPCCNVIRLLCRVMFTVKNYFTQLS